MTIRKQGSVRCPLKTAVPCGLQQDFQTHHQNRAFNIICDMLFQRSSILIGNLSVIGVRPSVLECGFIVVTM